MVCLYQFFNFHALIRWRSVTFESALWNLALIEYTVLKINVYVLWDSDFLSQWRGMTLEVILASMNSSCLHSPGEEIKYCFCGWRCICFTCLFALLHSEIYTFLSHEVIPCRLPWRYWRENFALCSGWFVSFYNTGICKHTPWQLSLSLL